MTALEPGSPRARLHPLVVACLGAIGARAVGVLLHFVSHDPNGNRISAAPFESLLLAIPYHGAVLITAAVVLLSLWKLLPPLRPGLTATGIVLATVAVVMGQIDLGMQWFIGHRFSPTAADTYLGATVFSTEVLRPLLFHPVYLTIGLLLIIVPVAAMVRSVVGAFRGERQRTLGWRMVGALGAVALLCRIPLELSHAHQRDVTRPPELLFLYHALEPRDVPAPADEARAIAELRTLVDPTGTTRWLDPTLPVVRAGRPARADGAPAGRVLPDVFVFAIESLRGADVGYVPGNYASGESPTPILDSLAAHGVVFSRYISTGNPSPRGFFGINTGVLDHREAFIICCSTETQFDALPLRMRRLGYFSLGVWGSNPSFDNQLFWANRWYDRVRSPGPAGPLRLTRALPDDRTMDLLLEEIAAHDRERPDQPLFTYVATAGTHEPYTIEPGSRLPRATVDAIADEKDLRRRYRMVLRQTDLQMGRVLAFLDARPTTRPRVVIVVGDHSDAAGDSIPPEFRGLPYDAVEWTAALIAGPPELTGPVPRVETFPASHADLMPTVLGLVGDDGPTIAMGTSLLADVPAERRSAISVSGFGYRMDRGGWSLLVRRETPEEFFTQPAFAPLTTARPGVEGSPFTPDDARRLWEGMNTWSWLIERNRVWRSNVLDDEGTLATEHR